MTKAEAQRRQHMNTALQSLGFTAEECEALRRISMTLHRWHELECGTDGGCIERHGDAGSPFWHRQDIGRAEYGTRIPDREAGAKKRLARIVARCNAYRSGLSATAVLNAITEAQRCDCRPVTTYIQTDPRGTALYILRPGDVPEGQTADCCYSRGIAVY